MTKPRYDETQLKSHPRRNRKQNELVKTMLKHLDLMLGENRAGELLAVFVELLKMAVNETPDKRLELRSIEIILNDYFHAKHQASGEALFKVNKDFKKLKAFEVVGKYVGIEFDRTSKGPVMWIRSRSLGQSWLIHISEEDYKDAGGTAKETEK